MATIRRLEQSSRVATFRHEHLDGVVDVGFLAANDSIDGDPVDGTIDKTQVGSGVAHLGRASDIQVPVTASGDHQVHVLVVDLRVGGILDLDTEVAGNVVGRQRWTWDRASCYDGNKGR